MLLENYSPERISTIKSQSHDSVTKMIPPDDEQKPIPQHISLDPISIMIDNNLSLLSPITTNPLHSTNSYSDINDVKILESIKLNLFSPFYCTTDIGTPQITEPIFSTPNLTTSESNSSTSFTPYIRTPPMTKQNSRSDSSLSIYDEFMSLIKTTTPPPSTPKDLDLLCPQSISSESTSDSTTNSQDITPCLTVSSAFKPYNTTIATDKSPSVSTQTSINTSVLNIDNIQINHYRLFVTEYKAQQHINNFDIRHKFYKTHLLLGDKYAMLPAKKRDHYTQMALNNPKNVHHTHYQRPPRRKPRADIQWYYKMYNEHCTTNIEAPLPIDWSKLSPQKKKKNHSPLNTYHKNQISLVDFQHGLRRFGFNLKITNNKVHIDILSNPKEPDDIAKWINAKLKSHLEQISFQEYYSNKYASKKW